MEIPKNARTVNRRSLLTGAVAALPAVPAFALPLAPLGSDFDTRLALCKAFEDMAAIMARLARETGQVGWSVSGSDRSDRGFGFDAIITEPVRPYDPVTKTTWIKDRFHLRLAYHDGKLIDETAWFLGGIPSERHG